MISPLTKPGFYPNISAVDYHADPVATPSLSSTIAKMLVKQSPKHGWLAHPKLGGVKVEDEDEDEEESGGDRKATAAQLTGILMHRILLGKGGEIEVVHADAYRSAAAKAQRDAALAAGRIPVLAHKLPQAEAGATSARQQLDDMGYDYVFRKGMNEVVIVWEENGVWFRAMIDNLIIDEDNMTAEVWDLKTTGKSSKPDACATQIGNLGYDLSLEFYLRGLVKLRPELAGRVKRRWAFVETNAPFATTPIYMSAEWEMGAAMKCDQAIARWRRCMETGKWPYYVDRLTRVEPKPWDMAEAMMASAE